MFLTLLLVATVIGWNPALPIARLVSAIRDHNQPVEEAASVDGHRRLECQRDAVQAVALSGGRWAIFKNMAKMAAATPAMGFGAGGEERVVFFRSDGIRQ